MSNLNSDNTSLEIAEVSMNLKQKFVERELESLNLTIEMNKILFERIDSSSEIIENGISIAESLQNKIPDSEYEIITHFINDVIRAERVLVKIFQEFKNIEKRSQQIAEKSVNDLEISISELRSLMNK